MSMTQQTQGARPDPAIFGDLLRDFNTVPEGTKIPLEVMVTTPTLTQYRGAKTNYSPFAPYVGNMIYDPDGARRITAPVERELNELIPQMKQTLDRLGIQIGTPARLAGKDRAAAVEVLLMSPIIRFSANREQFLALTQQPWVHAVRRNLPLSHYM